MKKLSLSLATLLLRGVCLRVSLMCTIGKCVSWQVRRYTTSSYPKSYLAPVFFNSTSITSFRKMSQSSVFVTRSDMPKEAIELLKKHQCSVEMWPEPRPVPREELLKGVAGKNALFCMLTEKINAELFDAAGPNLKVIGTMSVGFDHIDLEECKKRGVLVGNTPDVLTDATAELTVALLLATSRRLMEATKEVTNGGWGQCAWGPLWMCGNSLTGSVVGIVGLGRIGYAVAERLHAFKVKQIVYTGNAPKTKASDELNARFVSFEELLKVSDFVIGCCALNPNTAGLFNKDAFKKMKSSAVFINTSRGGLVNQDDLYEALTTGQIKAAGLDVTTPEPLPVDHKLTKLSNCVLLPHIGSATIETRTAMATLTARNILAGLKGSPLPCPI